MKNMSASVSELSHQLDETMVREESADLLDIGGCRRVTI